ncbi:MAG TPA: hypothetical protein VNX28_08900 [Gemmataceae bacterium]|nr:hypothetical protein [Gemmataceae bacterium]
MNRAIFHNRPDETFVSVNPLHRPARQLRQETDSMLRDMAYVLELTRRVKEQLRVRLEAGLDLGPIAHMGIQG